MRRFGFFAAALLFAAAPAAAETITVCTLVIDAATGERLKSEGDCDTRATPASTFKIPIALMGYDSGLLKSATEPALPFRPGDADWQPAWRQTTDPAAWMRHSVVWYSWRITTALGADRFAAYLRRLGYGNGDVSGDPGKRNGLTHSWLGTSLAISPVEQTAFLRRLLAGTLPVSPAAHAATKNLLAIGPQPSGWHVSGKTGSGASKNPDGRRAVGKPWGWFVGWAEKDGRTIVVARLTRDTTPPKDPPGPAARAAVLKELFERPGAF